MQNEVAALHNVVRDIGKVVTVIKSKSGRKGKDQKKKSKTNKKANTKASRRSTRNNPVSEDDDEEESNEGDFYLDSDDEENL